MKVHLAIAVSFLFASASYAAGASWGYEGEGAPERWGELSPEFSACSKGVNQSPINIKGAVKANLPPLKLRLAAGAQKIVNNGHTVQVSVSQGNVLTLDGEDFELQQFHFHTSSENQINGQSFPVEAHFVYKNKDGQLAVVGLMFKEGKENLPLASAWSVLPAEQGEPAELAKPVDLASLLPKKRTYYRFSGSLTTPPCSEGVRWLVLEEMSSISKEQVEKLAAAVHRNNARPVQPLNGRLIVR